MAGLDVASARLVPLAGSGGWLSRVDHAICFAETAEEAQVAELFAACQGARSSAEVLGRVVGRLSRAPATQWPGFALVTSADSEVVVLVYGETSVSIERSGGPDLHLTAETPGMWFTRAASGVTRIVIGKGADDVGAEGLADLRGGVLAADGAVLFAAPAVDDLEPAAPGDTGSAAGDGAIAGADDVGSPAGEVVAAAGAGVAAGAAGGGAGVDPGPTDGPADASPTDAGGDEPAVADEESGAPGVQGAQADAAAPSADHEPSSGEPGSALGGGPYAAALGSVARISNAPESTEEPGPSAGPAGGSPLASPASPAGGSPLASPAGPAGVAPLGADPTIVDIPGAADQRTTLAPATDASSGGVVVTGRYCGRHHFNAPRDRWCRVCGLPLGQDPGGEVEGVRPTLGVLVWDSGESDAVKRDTVVGRDPASDPGVVAGTADPLSPAGKSEGMSRVHAELRLIGWEILLADRGSTNGTFVWDETRQEWHRLEPGERCPLHIGVIVAFGERTATFEALTDA